VTLQTYYRVADLPTRQELANLGMDETSGAISRNRKAGRRVEIKAKPTKEKRPPGKGEWFLSGAIPEAYRSDGGMMSCYRIVKLVVVERIEYFKEV
jgi:hypothetical protein